MSVTSQITVGVVIPTINAAQRVFEMATLVCREPKVSEVVLVVSGDRPIEGWNIHRKLQVMYYDEVLPVSVARNIGAEKISSDFIVFLDDDNVLGENMVQLLLEYMRNHSECTTAGPWQYDANSPNKLVCTGAVHPKVGKTKILTSVSKTGREVRCDSIPNCFMVSRKTFQAVGGFDSKSFPMDYEESDLQLRLKYRYNGYTVALADATVYHYIRNGTMVQLVPKTLARAYTVGRNRFIFAARHHGIVGYCCAALLNLAPVSIAIICAILWCDQENPSISRMRLVWAYLRGVCNGLVMGVPQLAYRRKIKNDGVARGGQNDAYWKMKWRKENKNIRDLS